MELPKNFSEVDEGEIAYDILKTVVDETCNKMENLKNCFNTNDSIQCITKPNFMDENSAIKIGSETSEIVVKSNQKEMFSKNNYIKPNQLESNQENPINKECIEIDDIQAKSVQKSLQNEVLDCLVYIINKVVNNNDGSQEKVNENEQSISHNDAANAKEELKKKIQMAKASERDLWISNVSLSTKALELKNLFSKHGKVIAAKIISNTKSPLATCYGYITMKSKEQAQSCIKYLNNTELCGQLISVGLAQQDFAPKTPEEKSNKVIKEKDAKKAGNQDNNTNSQEGKYPKKLCSHKIRDAKPSESSRSCRHNLSREKKPSAPVNNRSSRSSTNQTSKSETHKRHSRSPRRSPYKRKSKSPKRSRSPRKKYSRSPKRRCSRSPRKRHSRSPRRRYSRSPKRHDYEPHSPRRTSGYQRLPSPPYNKPTISKSYAPSYLNMLTFEKIKEEQNRERERQRIREMRDHSKYRSSDFRSSDLNDLQEINKKEALRLELERKNLKMEKERLNLELARLEKRAVTNKKLLERERELYKKSTSEPIIPSPPVPPNPPPNYFIPNFPPNSMMPHEFPMQMPPQGFMPFPFPPFYNGPLNPNSMPNMPPL